MRMIMNRWVAETLDGQKYLVIGFELIFPGVLTRSSKVEVVQLNADFSFVHSAVLYLQLLCQGKVIAPVEVDLTIREVVGKHHSNKRFRNVGSANLNVDPGIFDAHAFLNA